jgi:acetyl-CoA C-acetyltransferase
VGASGAILAVKLMYEMERRQARYGLASLCIGGGQGIASIFENISERQGSERARYLHEL